MDLKDDNLDEDSEELDKNHEKKRKLEREKKNKQKVKLVDKGKDKRRFSMPVLRVLVYTKKKIKRRSSWTFW